jgi:hypothetical protein
MGGVHEKAGFTIFNAGPGLRLQVAMDSLADHLGYGDLGVLEC